MAEIILNSDVKTIMRDPQMRSILTNFVNDEHSNMTIACNYYAVLLKISDSKTLEENEKQLREECFDTSDVDKVKEGSAQLTEFLEREKKKCEDRVNSSHRYSVDFRVAMKTQFMDSK